MGQGRLLDHREHPNRDRYGHQKQLVVEIGGYAYVVSYVEDHKKRFFKTFFPSRKDTRDYLLTPGSHE
ncbi:hypothetical protein [Candidatus Thiosymbion oneisti]|uniref:hypothetical protein n=1 Tax=Candidatus Thiosymbion oneisti TaxID=589554 RepID=UPI001C4046EE|nr:hypothetical protein [Candidatus Thiosymbion oneisti]